MDVSITHYSHAFSNNDKLKSETLLCTCVVNAYLGINTECPSLGTGHNFDMLHAYLKYFKMCFKIHRRHTGKHVSYDCYYTLIKWLRSIWDRL